MYDCDRPRRAAHGSGCLLHGHVREEPQDDDLPLPDRKPGYRVGDHTTVDQPGSLVGKASGFVGREVSGGRRSSPGPVPA